jgi:formylglycine-generating enzyme required for sulfatase activity/serine/threonine protein kinase
MILKRFEREAKSLGGLQHPNIVGVIDYGEYEGSPYLVMIYLPGGTLKDKLGKPIPWRDAVRLIIPIARALEYTHEHNIINRDIKPSNILLTERGQPMLTDFGLVKIFETKGATNLTTSGAGLGTPDYMAPEQWTGDATALSDMYSLGVVLYEMITAYRPYMSDTPAGVLLKQINEPLPLPKQYIPDLPHNVESVLLKVLARRPEDRYPDMRSFANELQNLLDGREVTATTIKIKKLREQMTGIAEPSQADQNKPAQDNVGQGRITPPPSTPPSARPKRKFPVLGVILGILVFFGICGSCWFVSSKIGWLAETFLTPQVVVPATEADIPPAETIPAPLNPTDTPAPVETSMPVEITDAKNVPMRLVPAGEFTMGNDEGDAESRPASLIFVDTFYIDKFEVTNEMYDMCVSDGGCRMPRLPGSATHRSYYNSPNFANYPVLYVDWLMAKTYCEWRGARLPTEAEWEKAARGTDDQRAYPWGDKFDCKFANHSGCVGDTAPVNQYDEGLSPYGVYGMSGNVWEWTSSLYSFYPYSPTDGREDPAATGYRMARGGSWTIFGSTGGSIRIDTRLKLDAVYYGAYVGVRCALTK